MKISNRNTVLAMAVIATLSLSTNNAMAADWTDKVMITGFASSIYRTSSEATYFNGDGDGAGINQDASYQGTRVGLNINAQINKKVGVAAQFISSREEGNYTTHIDWGFISINLIDGLSLRTGKVKFPVGIVNEYIDVGYAFPWISPPQLFYGEESAGAQATREAYSGASMFWEHSTADWSWSADLFHGEVALESMLVKGISGLTLRANWDETVIFQASSYSGKMDNPMMPMMDGEDHSANTFGIKADWNNIIVYTEIANVDMGSFDMGEADSKYLTLGYRLNDWLPHITLQDYEKGKGTMMHHEQQIQTLGVRYDFMPSTALKIEYSRIFTDNGTGLFDGVPSDDSVNMYGLAVDVVF